MYIAPLAKCTLPQTAFGRVRLKAKNLLELWSYRLMAIYRLSSSGISRGKGQSAIASAAYRSGENLYDEKINQSFDYTRKQDVSYSEILLPENADRKYENREKLWNHVEESEKRKNSELAKEYQLALPREIDQEENIRLVREFAKKEWVEKGIAVDICFHDLDKDNPHAHIMTTTRSFSEDGNLGKKERSFKDRTYLTDLRQSWEKHLNITLERHEINLVTCESLAARGIDLDPINTDLKGRDCAKEVERQREERSKKLLDNPSIAADMLTDKKAVVNDYDIYRFVEKNIVSEDKQEFLNKLMLDDNFVVLSAEGNGKYTSSAYLLAEKCLVENAEKLNNPSDKYQKYISDETLYEISKRKGLSEGQHQAMRYAVDEKSNVKNITGFAGSGKSYALSAIREAYEKEGYECKGIALSGIIADALEKDAGISDSRTIASFLYQHERGKIELKENSILFLDEASMVGVRQMAEITQIVKDAGAKIITTGDDNQLQAIQAGGASKLIKDVTTSFTLDEIRRQKDFSDRQATYDLSTGNAEQALKYYDEKGAINIHRNDQEMMESIKENYMAWQKESKSQLILAHTRVEVSNINKTIHEELKTNGKLGQRSQKINGKEFSEGDRFVFLENDRGIDVKNGTTGTIERIDKDGEYQIKTDDGRTVNFNAKDYTRFDHAYAMTIHKAQGVSVDANQLCVSKNADSHLMLVGMTRHKEDLKIHAVQHHDQQEAGNYGLEDIIKSAQKSHAKEYVSTVDAALENHVHKLADVHINIDKSDDHKKNIDQLKTDEVNKILDRAARAADLEVDKAKIMHNLSDETTKVDTKINKIENEITQTQERKLQQERDNSRTHSKDNTLDRTKDIGGYEIGF